MPLPEELKFAVRGFSPQRMGYLFVLLSVCLAPAHMFVPCAASGMITGFVGLGTLAVSVLCFFAPRSDRQRFSPAVYGLFVFLLHVLLTH